MPIYEYVCSQGHKFEMLRSMDRVSESTLCPECKTESHKSISLFAVFGRTEEGETAPLAGSGGCACAAGGTCGCRSLN